MTSEATKTILVADDDAAIRTVVTQALTRAGYDVRATGTASSLWHWVVNGEGDLVITDVVLPDEEHDRHRHYRGGARGIRLSAEAFRPE